MSEEPHVSGEQFSGAAAPVVNGSADSHSGGALMDQNVPLVALQQERAQRQQLQEELRMIKDHLALLQANQARTQEKAKDELESLQDGDVMTYGEFKKLAGKFQQQVQMTVEEMRMVQQYPDYQEVVTKYLPEVLKNNPSLRRSLQQTQDYQLAYYLAKNSEGYRSQSQSAQKNADAERLLKNAQLSGSLSSVGGTSPINSAKRYKDMSDDDFRKEMAKNMGYN